MVALFRIGLPIAEQELIDSRPIKTYSDLYELATTLKSANIRPKEQPWCEEGWQTQVFICVALDAKVVVIKATTVRPHWMTIIGR